jgi:quinol monooxygenase YgiN
MYALLVTADVEPGKEEEGLQYLRTMLPQLKQIPGLLSGYWLATTKDGESLAIVLFENEGDAQEMAQIGLPNAPQPPGATFRGAEVREVVAHI